MTLPNFLCVGTQKSGTTTLHDILKQHPDIYIPFFKESNFFSEDEIYKKGINWYEHESFGKHKDQKIIGEISPDYMFLDFVPERISIHLGKEIKLLFILRNPVDRAYSHYTMNSTHFFDNETFERAIQLEDDRTAKGLYEKRVYSYISRGFYARQIKNYMKYFPKDNMMFVIFEDDFLKEMDKTINNLLRFLNVEDAPLNTNIKSNPASVVKSKMLRDAINKPTLLKKICKFLLPSTTLRRELLFFIDKKNKKAVKFQDLDDNIKTEMLKRYFIDDINELENILGRDLSIWREFQR